MNAIKLIEKFGLTGVFDIAKALRYHFPKVSTKRINDLLLQVESADAEKRAKEEL